MKKINIKYPDGSIHQVAISVAKRAVNKKTGEEEIIIEYIDYSDGNKECYTPIINVLGKWYKNPNHDDYTDYAFFDRNEEKIVKELPVEMEYLETDKAKDFDKTYRRDMINKITNLIKSKYSGLLQNSYVKSLLSSLEDLFIGHLSLGEIDNVFEQIVSSLFSSGELIRKLSAVVDKFESYEKIKIRSDKISSIVRQLRLKEIYVPGVDFDIIILKLKSLEFLDNDLADMLINEISKLVNNNIEFDRNALLALGMNILQIIYRYEELYRQSLKTDVKYGAKEEAVLFPPSEKQLNKQSEKFLFKYEYLLKKPSSSAVFRNHYVAIAPLATFGKNEILPRFQTFMTIGSASSSAGMVTYYSEILHGQHRNVVLDYIGYLGEKFRKEGTVVNMPLYFENYSGEETGYKVFDVYYFGICDTKEKIMDVARTTEVDVFMPDKQFIIDSNLGYTFQQAMEGNYSMSVVDGEYYEGMLNNKSISRNVKK